MPHSIKPQALDDLGHIYLEGVERWGVAQAEAYAEGLHDAFDFLADNPRITRLRSELKPPLRAYRFGSHMIIYDLGPSDRVMVLRIRHEHEDWLSNPL